MSIGYAACHWCHVMERESFEDEGTARIMNEHFINIKIDREERPDIDHIYMDALQAMAGSGGWPLNMFLLPNRQPFYGGTYFPPKQAYNRPSWKEVLLAVSEAFKTKRSELEEQASNLTQHLHQSNQFGMEAVNMQLPKEELFTTAQCDAIVLAIMDGKPVQVMGTVYRSGTDHGIVGRRDHGVLTPASLKGKKVGVTQGTSGHFTLDVFLNTARLQGSDVTMVNYKPEELGQALQRGDVDVGFESYAALRGAIDDIVGDHRARKTELGEDRDFAAVEARIGRDNGVVRRVEANGREGAAPDAVARDGDAAGTKDVDAVAILAGAAVARGDALDAIAGDERARYQCRCKPGAVF